MKLKILGLIFVFIFALILRLWNFNQMGRWWDEYWYVEKGYYLIELLKKGDLFNQYWYTFASDHPPLANYFYGIASYKDLIKYDPNAKPVFQVSGMPKGAPTFNYDFTYSRLFSVLASVIAILLVFILGSRYFSFFIGLASSIIFAMLPHFLGFSQLADLESWIVLFFTLSVFLYFLYLDTGKKKYLILTGISAGLSLAVKQSNVLIFVLFPVIYFLSRKQFNLKKIYFRHIVYIFIVGIAALLAVYPMPLFNLPSFFKFSFDLWFKNEGRIPELLFGIHMGARSFYYLVAFFVTTPVLIIILSFLGVKKCWENKRKWIFSGIIVWFLVPFLMSFFHSRTNMVRYIIEFYAPLSILAALGLEKISQLISKEKAVKSFMLILTFLYLLAILIRLTPFYLDYYNEFVGGTKNVYQNKLFFLGWFGEGLKDPGLYLAKNAQKDSLIGMAINPQQTLYRVPSLKYVTYQPSGNYDYVVVNYFNIIRIGFNEAQLNKNYKLVYREMVDSAVLASVYKHK